MVRTRTFHTSAGPADGQRLLTGMRLVPSGTDGVYIGIDRSTVLRVSANGQAVNESTANPDLADWSMGVTFDTQAQRVVLVTLGGEGALYQRTPAGVWSTIASMQNEDLESLVYNSADNCFYGIEVYNGAPTAPATLLKYSASGEKLGEISLPAFPVDLRPGDHTAKLVAIDGKIIALVERSPESILQVGDHSRIYVIDPATGSAALTYDRTEAGGAPKVRFTAPQNESVVTVNTSVNIEIEASDPDNDLRFLTLRKEPAELKMWSFDPSPIGTNKYTFTWTPTTTGVQTLVAKANDLSGRIAEASLTIIVTNTPPPPPPDTNITFAAWYFKNDAVIAVTYTQKGPVDEGTLYRGLPVAQAGYRYLGRDGHTIFQWDNERDIYTETSPGGDFSWPRGTTLDSKRNRFIVVTLVGEGTLYAVTPATLQWSTIASMNNVDVDSVVYHPADDLLYMVENHGGNVRILRYNSEGQPTGQTITIPNVPLEIGSYYQSRLISAGSKIALLIEPTPGWTPTLPAESRIYVIDPVSGASELTYRKLWETWPPKPPAPTLKITSPANGSEILRGVPIHFTAEAQDGAFSSVIFLADGQVLGEGKPSTNAPGRIFTYVWSNATEGIHTVSALGKTSTGTSISAELIRVKVLPAPNSPTVRILSPTANDVIHVGDRLPIKVEVFDADNNLRSVSSGRQSLTFDPPPTGTNVYTFDFFAERIGTNTITVTATDGAGLRDVATVTVIVRAAETPTISITSPTNNTEFAQGKVIPINARGNTAFTSVSIFADGTKIGDAREALVTIYPPMYTFPWSNAPAGEHTLVAIGKTSTTSATSAPVHIVVRAASPIFTIERDLPPSYIAGQWVNVSINARPGEGVNAWAVEETPPAGWQFGQASFSGVYDATSGKIKWGPFTDANARTLFYTIRPPTNSVGAKTFSGVASVNGTLKTITGDTVISGAPSHHPADLSPEDNRLTVNEVTAYAAAWKTGTNWPRGPSPIPIEYVTRAGQIWKSGELYEFNPALPAPACWVPVSQQIRALSVSASMGASAATRTLPPAFTPGHAITVSVNVRPAAGVQNYAIEERPPAGWTIADASGGTIADGSVRYGPFYDAQERTFVYRLIPAASPSGEFTGDASFDGSKDAIEGATTLNQSTTIAEHRDGRVYLHFNATPGESFILESADSIDRPTWQFEANIQGSDGPVNLPPIEPSSGQKFYRLRSVAQ